MMYTNETVCFSFFVDVQRIDSILFFRKYFPAGMYCFLYFLRRSVVLKPPKRLVRGKQTELHPAPGLRPHDAHVCPGVTSTS